MLDRNQWPGAQPPPWMKEQSGPGPMPGTPAGQGYSAIPRPGFFAGQQDPNKAILSLIPLAGVLLLILVLKK